MHDQNTPKVPFLDLALELAAIEQPTWDAASARLHALGVPVNDGNAPAGGQQQQQQGGQQQQQQPAPIPGGGGGHPAIVPGQNDTPPSGGGQQQQQQQQQQPAPGQQQQQQGVTPPADWTPPSYEDWLARENAIATANRKVKDLEKGKGGGQQQQQPGQQQQQPGQQQQQQPDPAADRATKLERQLRTTAIGNTVTSIATQLGFRNPAIAGRLIDLDGIDVDIDDDTLDVKIGDAAKAELRRRLEQQVQQDSYLVTPRPGQQLPSAGGGGAQAPASPNAAMNSAIRAATGRQS